jgi:hypothetical protein
LEKGLVGDDEVDWAMKISFSARRSPTTGVGRAGASSLVIHEGTRFEGETGVQFIGVRLDAILLGCGRAA